MPLDPNLAGRATQPSAIVDATTNSSVTTTTVGAKTALDVALKDVGGNPLDKAANAAATAATKVIPVQQVDSGGGQGPTYAQSFTVTGAKTANNDYLVSTGGVAMDSTTATASTTATPLYPVKILGAGGNSPSVNLGTGIDALRNLDLAPDSTALAQQAQAALAATTYTVPTKAVGPAGKDVAAALGTTSGFQVVQVDASGNQIPRVSTNGTLLASAARTATPTVAGQINPASSGTLFILTITANASVAGVKFSVNAQDGLGNSAALYTGAALTTVGTFYYYFGAANGGLIGTGGTSGLTGGLQLPLPRLYTPTVTHADASSVTYSLVAAVLA